MRSTLRNLLHTQKVESDLDDEIASYVATATDEKIAAGLAPEEARRRVLAECGGTEHVKQAVRNGRAGALAESLLQDIRFGVRQLRRNPAFAWTAIITLALGIGATTAIFSAVYALLLRPLPYPGSDRLMLIYQHTKYDAMSSLIGQDFVAAQSTLRSFESVAGYTNNGDQNLTGAGAPMRVLVIGVTANFFPTLRVPPALGRFFLSGEDGKDGPAVVILSHRLWQSRLNSDPAIIGRTITLAGKAQTVVGVLPAHFIFPDSAAEPDLYVPAGIDADASLGTTNVSISLVQTIARLRDGATLPQAQADLKLFADTRVKGYAPFFVNWAEGRQILAQPLQRYLAGDDREPLLILLACVAVVLLIAYANVANLQLARSVTREPEMVLRGALGADRLRLIRQSLVENLTLSAIASVLGLAIAAAVTWLIHHSSMPGQLSSGSPVADLLQAPFGKLSAAVEVNGWVLAFTAGLALLTTILFGLAPAIGSSRSDLSTTLQGAARGVSSGRQQRRLRSVLLVSEIGLAVMLLTGAGLLIRSFTHVLQNDTGFDPRQCLTARMQRNLSEELEKTRAFAHQLLPQVQVLPGVKVAAIGSALPLEDNGWNRTLAFGDRSPLPVGQRPGAYIISISPEYFAVTGTRLLQGRTFTYQDNAAAVSVAIVNQAFAHKYLNGDALGKQFRININGQFIPNTAVGIVQDVRYDGLETDVRPVIYLPFDQAPYREVNILLRTSVEPASLTAAMRKAAINIDPTQPLFDVATMESRLSQSLAQRRLIMLLIVSFASLAMVLAGIGVYGVFTYWVSQRRKEMAIRLALGASRPELLRLTVSQAMPLILAGGVIGIAGGWFLNHLLASMLVAVKVHDPVSLSLAWALMTLIALVGSCVPARSAARTNVISVLHSE
ncbi:ABC transporter permease [Granulicella sp. dw_53]|uniref:ABC transporter permease n=1 Tax=Granulicella sp. dw_53 TaxID=2719792 RepID=UPI001BD2E95E|nr:ABC transporter permease [Granulicella sp. dw_53]